MFLRKRDRHRGGSRRDDERHGKMNVRKTERRRVGGGSDIFINVIDVPTWYHMVSKTGNMVLT